MKTLLTAILTFLTSLNPLVVSMFAVVTTVASMFAFMNALWSELFARIGLISGGTFGTVSLSGLQLIDTIVPLTEFCGYLSAYMTLLGVCAIIRIIKSFVPTVAT